MLEAVLSAIGDYARCTLTSGNTYFFERKIIFAMIARKKHSCTLEDMLIGQKVITTASGKMANQEVP